MNSGESLASTCQGCLTNCSVRVSGSAAFLQVTGNAFNLATGGRYCPNVRIAVEQQADPDRLLFPLRRRNERKGRGVDPQWERISWDDALDELAGRLAALRQAGESHRVAVLKGRSTGLSSLLADAFPKIYGTPNSIGHNGICAEAEKFATGCVDGVWDYHDYDFDQTSVMLLWGTDPLASNRQRSRLLAQWDAMCEETIVFCIDPHLSRTAEASDEWVPVIPGTDGALACAYAHVILTEGLWYKDFVGDFVQPGHAGFVPGRQVAEDSFEERSTHGLVRWWNAVLKDCTPQWAEGITGIPADDIARVARHFAGGGRGAVSWVSTGIAMTARGVYAAMAAYALNGLVGSVAPAGTVFDFVPVPVQGLPAAEPYIDDVARAGCAQPTIDQRGTRGLAAACKGKVGANQATNRIADALLAGDPYPLDTVIAYWTNPAFSCTGADRWEQALSHLPFLVYVTTHLSETAQFADIVLPAKHHMLEAWGYAVCHEGLRSALSLEQPILQVPGEALADEYEFPFLLAEKLADHGFGALRDYYRTVTDPCTAAEPQTGEQLGVYALMTMTQPLWQEGDEVSAEAWQAFVERGVWNSAPSERSQDRRFPTPSGRFEFESGALARTLADYAARFGLEPGEALADLNYVGDESIAAFPHYEPPVRVGDEAAFPLLFTQHKSSVALEGRSANTKLAQRLRTMDPGEEPYEDVLKVHPDDLAAAGVADGDEARLSWQGGSAVVRVKAWKGVRPGVVAKCYGQGHWAYGHVAALDFDNFVPRGVNNNEVIAAEFERITGATARNGGLMRVRLEPLA